MNSILDPKEAELSEPKNSEPLITSIFDEQEPKDDEPFVLSPTEPMTVAETVRSSGLAYSAAIALSASVAFMLLIGWGADLLLGSSPWGIVIGVLIGAAIGFYQFFRVTSQIFKK
ncbi:MAG: AtpZ/AtpI family protein [Blastocatellia bacterium]|nr:AtpZ/AtpI family protein [Blastocatellia bacterium]